MPKIILKHNYVRFPMIILNILLIFFLMYVINGAIDIICDNFLARSFIEETMLIPLVPQLRKQRIFLFATAMIINIFLRETVANKQKNIIHILCALDIIVSILIIYNLSFAYKGVLLLTFANIIHYVEKNPMKYFLCFTTVLAFIFFDHSFLSYFFNLVTVNQLISYYPKPQQNTYLTVSNILSSLNEICLFIFMIIIVQEQVNQNRVINQLNMKLNLTVEQLKNANLELENYARLTEETAKIKERNRLAREIHDTMGHTLTGISMGLEAALTLLDSNSSKVRDYITKIQAMAKNGLHDVRRSVNELKVDAIEQYTLVPAIEKMVDGIRKMAQINAIFNIKGSVSGLARNEEETIYRIVQESTTNTIKHSNADSIIISLDFREFEVEIHITDNGKTEGEFIKGFGATHMEERVRSLNGSVKYLGKTDDGFCVNVILPLKMRSII